MSEQHHVVYSHEKKSWGIKVENGVKSIQDFETKDEAITRARELSINNGTELIIHRKDGAIKQKDSHGNDPKDIKG